MPPTWRALPLWLKIVLLPTLVLTGAVVVGAAIWFYSGVIATIVWLTAGIFVGIRAIASHLVEPIKNTWHSITHKFKRKRIDLEVMPPSNRAQEGA